MNCAPVVVVGTAGSTFTGPRIFEANIFGQGTCNTVEGVDVVYPNPGPSVHFGGSFVDGTTGPETVLANCNFDQNVMLTTTGGTASASAGKAASGGSSSGNGTDVAPGMDRVFFGSGINFVEVSTSPEVSPVAEETPAVVAQPTTASVAPPSTTPVDPPPSIATAAVNNGSGGSGGSTSNQAGAPCSPDGTIACAADGLHFFMCDYGALVDMGSVAAGTTCSDGTITRKRGLPPQSHRRRRGHTFGRLF